MVGDANPDLVLRGDVAPRWGQAEQLLDSADLTLGGSAAIVAAGAARLGLRTALVARVGADLLGEQVLAWLRAREVDVSRVAILPTESTGLSVILSGAEDRSILTLPGAIPLLQPADVDDATLEAVRHVHVASFFLQPTLAAGLPAPARAGARGRLHGLARHELGSRRALGRSDRRSPPRRRVPP